MDNITDLIHELLEDRDKKDRILEILPDDPATACAILSCVLDEYFKTHAIAIRTGWKIFNQIADQVHDEMEDE